VTANKIRVQMRLNYILDFKTLSLGLRDVLVNVALRIDNRSFTFRPDQVRSVCETREIELLEVHNFVIEGHGLVRV
jgi:hypothetical protein